MNKQNPVAQHCMVCGESLAYHESAVEASCHYCAQPGQALILCPQGHFVCDHCHGAGSLELLPRLAERVKSEAAEEILEELLQLPELPMHGPEHHAMAALALLLAASKQGAVLPENFVAEAIRRAMQVPGGFCGYAGACGAGISLGIAVSLLAGATPLKGAERGLANRASALGLTCAGDGEARCCRRALRKVVREGRAFLAVQLGIELPALATETRCREMARNRECPGKSCPFF